MLVYPNSIIYNFSEEGIKEIKYEETESYKIYKSFTKNPKHMFNLFLQ